MTISKILNSRKTKFIVLLLGLYLVSAGISWLGFSKFMGKGNEIISPVGLQQKRSRINTDAPKTEICPVNGAKYTKDERQIWEKRRPLTVMIENHEDARPQSGLSKADIVYEAVAEGGITRFMAVFYCGAAAQDLIIGPVRSARMYFMDWASEYSDFPLYAHVGGANRSGPADALGAISQYGWLTKGNDMNQFAIGFPTFWRDYERIGHPVATEHTMYASTDKLWDKAAERGLNNVDSKGKAWDVSFVPWKFADGKIGSQVASLSFPFWKGYEQYTVKWIYDLTNNTWKREDGGKPHTDLDNNQQITSNNVVVQFVKERSLGDPEKHMLYTTTGTGDALVFQNGQVIQATWAKKDRTSRTIFTDRKGKEIRFVPGQIWIEAVPLGIQVSY